MVKYKIIDNFLNSSDFTELKNNIFPIPVGSSRKNDFRWEYITSQASKEEDRFNKVTNIEHLNLLNNWGCRHSFLTQTDIQSSLRWLSSLLNKINPLALYRIQANLTVQQEKNMRSPFHIDYGASLKHTSMITSIFYMNTTNGATILEDGTEIECRVNRLVTFPHNTYHSGVMCTDQPYKIVINLNYFKDLDLS